ncbi:hypothetical protein RMATCC62417_02476 [Rhizopus microsporus]|nr:hypothetical protein RMATCC62417_02476 [Rhizopus microsporus]
MSGNDNLEDELRVIQEETEKAREQLAIQERKLMMPIWEKRREIVKKIPNFYATALGNTIFGMSPTEDDIEALENLTDFHVEFDDERPYYRKYIAKYKKNGVFKNEVLTKEVILDPESNGTVISKSTIDYHEGKAKSNKRRAADDDQPTPLFEWFASDDVQTGVYISEEVFPNLLEFYTGHEDTDDENEEIELNSEDEEEEEEEEEEKPKSKRARK